MASLARTAWFCPWQESCPLSDASLLYRPFVGLKFATLFGPRHSCVSLLWYPCSARLSLPKRQRACEPTCGDWPVGRSPLGMPCHCFMHTLTASADELRCNSWYCLKRPTNQNHHLLGKPSSLEESREPCVCQSCPRAITLLPKKP